MRGTRGSGGGIARLVAVGILVALLPLASSHPALAARVKTIAITDASVVEGDAGQQNVSFTISWTGSKGGPAPSVHWATADGTALVGSDYVAGSATPTLTNGGCRCATATVAVKGDKVTEGTETFVVNLSNAQNAVIGDAQAVGTIYDNEGPPALVVTDTAAPEGTSPLSFTVELTNPSAVAVTVDYATADGTAVAGADYAAASGSLGFAPGQTTATVDVAVTNDVLAEDDETVLLDLSNASGAGIVDAEGMGTIVDDDPDPGVSVGDVSVSEGDTGSTNAVFTVSLDAPAGRETAVDWATSDGTAVGGSDYSGSSGTVTFPAGVVQKNVKVPVTGDVVHEDDETFAVTLSGEVNLTLVDPAATATIVDDDPVPTVAAEATSVPEGNGAATTATVTFALSNPSTDDVTFDWATADGTATAGADYAAASGSATIPAGQTSVTADVTVDGDTAFETDETFTVSVSTVANGIAGPDATVTIANDDKAPAALILKAVKTKTTVKARGLLWPSVAGMKVKVLLFVRAGGSYRKLAVKVVTLTSIKDRNHDGVLEGAYVAAFPLPAKGRYRFVARFGGDATHLKAKTSAVFSV